MFFKSYERVRAEIEKLPLGIPTEVDLLGYTIFQWRRHIPGDLRVKTRVDGDRLVVTRFDNRPQAEYKKHIEEVIRAGGGPLIPRMKCKALIELTAAQMGVMAIYDEKSHYLTVGEGVAKPEDDNYVPHLFDIDKWE